MIMGTVNTIDFHNFPKQSDRLNSRVLVYFHYDTTKQISGVVVRHDVEEPHQTIIKLDDGRYVRSVECAYRYL